MDLQGVASACVCLDLSVGATGQPLTAARTAAKLAWLELDCWFDAFIKQYTQVFRLTCDSLAPKMLWGANSILKRLGPFKGTGEQTAS